MINLIFNMRYVSSILNMIDWLVFNATLSMIVWLEIKSLFKRDGLAI